MKITITHNNKTYVFEHGFEVLIFDCAINNDFDNKHSNELNDFISLVSDCYLKDLNQTPLGALSDYMAENWDDVKKLSRFDILEKFYNQIA